MVLLPGCKCCGGGGPCWRCYGKYDWDGAWPPCPKSQCLIDGKAADFPSFISFKSSLSLGPYLEGTAQDYDLEAADAWLAGLDFRFILSGENIYSVGSAFNWLECKQIRNDIWGGGFAEYQREYPSNICGQPNQAGPFTSRGDIALSCKGLVASGGESRSGFFVRSCFGETSFSLSLLRFQQFACNQNSFEQSFTIGGTTNDPFRGLSITLEKCTSGSFGGLRGARYAVNGSAEISFDFLPADKTGSCFLKNGECENTTYQECVDQCGIFTPDVTCNDNSFEPVEAEEYQCFDAQPDEDGWIATGDCQTDATSCAEECPPEEPTTPTGARIMTTTKTTGGPGTELKRLLGSFGIQSKEKGCGCRSMQRKMDKPGWAVSHKKEIIDHLAAEAKKRRLPFIRLAAEKLLELAIRRADIRK